MTHEMSRHPSLEDELSRLKFRLHLLEALLEEHGCLEVASTEKEAIARVLAQTVKASIKTVDAMEKLMPMPISSYAGEPIKEWLEGEAADWLQGEQETAMKSGAR